MSEKANAWVLWLLGLGSARDKDYSCAFLTYNSEWQCLCKHDKEGQRKGPPESRRTYIGILRSKGQGLTWNKEEGRIVGTTTDAIKDFLLWPWGCLLSFSGSHWALLYRVPFPELFSPEATQATVFTLVQTLYPWLWAQLGWGPCFLSLYCKGYTMQPVSKCLLVQWSLESLIIGCSLRWSLLQGLPKKHMAW